MRYILLLLTAINIFAGAISIRDIDNGKYICYFDRMLNLYNGNEYNLTSKEVEENRFIFSKEGDRLVSGNGEIVYNFHSYSREHNVNMYVGDYKYMRIYIPVNQQNDNILIHMLSDNSLYIDAHCIRIDK